MAHIYNTKKKVQAYLDEHPMKQGFYKNNKGVVRFMYSLGSAGEDVFIGYVTKQSAINKYLGKSKTMAVTSLNVRSEPIFDWFANAEFLGTTPENAGLLGVK